MRAISFMLTEAQVLDESKDVTRRNGWINTKPKQRLRGVRKAMGLKKGEKQHQLKIIEVVSARREPLRAMTDNIEYGRRECIREGFPEMEPADFVAMFCKSHKGVTPETMITRIEFGYVADTESA